MYPKYFFADSPGAVESGSCFVLMPFAEEFRPVYDAIADAIEGPEVGFSCHRADELFGGGHIMADILDGIARAEVVVADMTTRNPNVFYELGIAHMVKDLDKVLIITQSMNDVPFDLRPFRCLIYDQSQNGLRQLKRQVIDAIKQSTQSAFRLVAPDGVRVKFPVKLPGEGRYLYDFEIQSYSGYDFAKFRLSVRQHGVDKRDVEMSSDTYGLV